MGGGARVLGGNARPSANKQPSNEQIEQAAELLRFAEDQFVVWQPVKDPEGWMRVMPNRRQGVAGWITPCVLEQYACYGPVARSSAVLPSRSSVLTIW